VSLVSFAPDPQYASWLYNPWIGISGSRRGQLNADLHIVDWLEAIGQKFDVVTDET